MSSSILISYDGTANDDDALALGRMLSRGGATMALAYVRHSREFDSQREELAQHDAERRLEQGSSWLGDESIPRHVVVHPSTWEGLAQLAELERASLIVFGSDYRTSPGHVAPGTTAQHLLEGGPVAIAVAPAGLRAEPDARFTSVSVIPPDAENGALQTAANLAQKLGTSVTDQAPGGSSSLLVVASAPGAGAGRLRLSGTARNRLSSARCPMLFLPAKTRIDL